MSELAPYEEQNIITNPENTVPDFDFENYGGVEPLSPAELAQFAATVTLPQAVAVQPAFDSFVQRQDAAYARPSAFTSAAQPAEPAIFCGDL